MVGFSARFLKSTSATPYSPSAVSTSAAISAPLSHARRWHVVSVTGMVVVVVGAGVAVVVMAAGVGEVGAGSELCNGSGDSGVTVSKMNEWIFRAWSLF